LRWRAAGVVEAARNSAVPAAHLHLPADRTRPASRRRTLGARSHDESMIATWRS